jgi:hypothetical protein
MNCGPVLALIFLGLCAFAIGFIVAHELITRWRYRQALRTLIEGETVIEWRKPIRTKQ